MAGYTVKREEQLFFINSTGMRGLQNAQIQYDVNSKPLKFLGVNTCREVPVGNYQGTVNLQYLMIGSDVLLPYTGMLSFNGYILKSLTNNTENFGFLQGYLNTYSINVSVGQIPDVSVNINVFGNVGKIPLDQSPDLGSMVLSSLPVRIVGPNSVKATFNDFDTAKILSFNVNITVPRVPIYQIGYQTPNIVEIGWPIQNTISFKISAKDYTGYQMRNYPHTLKTLNSLGLSFNDIVSNTTVASFSFNNLTFVGESYEAPVDGNSIVNLTYRSYGYRP